MSWNSFHAMDWWGNFWKVGKFWLGVLLAVGLQVLLVIGYVNLNPFVRHFPSVSYFSNSFDECPDHLFPPVSRLHINAVPSLYIHGPNP
jgi:hypothetical protein